MGVTFSIEYVPRILLHDLSIICIGVSFGAFSSYAYSESIFVKRFNNVAESTVNESSLFPDIFII